MRAYKITCSVFGHCYGVYLGETPEQALQAMADEAGYIGPIDTIDPSAVCITPVEDDEEPQGRTPGCAGFSDNN